MMSKKRRPRLDPDRVQSQTANMSEQVSMEWSMEFGLWNGVSYRIRIVFTKHALVSKIPLNLIAASATLDGDLSNVTR